jgi:hypothetical protein
MELVTEMPPLAPTPEVLLFFTMLLARTAWPWLISMKMPLPLCPVTVLPVTL